MKKSVALLVAGLSVAALPARAQGPGINTIDTVVVIYAENRSFDNLYGHFPGRQRPAERHAGKFRCSSTATARCSRNCRRSGTA